MANDAVSRLEKVGTTVETTEKVIVVGAYPGSDPERRFNITKDFLVYARRGVAVGDPKFYRVVETTMVTVEEIGEAAFWAEQSTDGLKGQ